MIVRNHVISELYCVGVLPVLLSWARGQYRVEVIHRGRLFLGPPIVYSINSKVRAILARVYLLFHKINSCGWGGCGIGGFASAEKLLLLGST